MKILLVDSCRTRLAALVITGLVSVVGCSGAASPGAGAGTPSTASADSASGAQPFDAFLGVELAFVEYAENEFVARCMKEQGFEQLASFPTPRLRRAFPELLVTVATFGPVTEEQARELGFGSHPPAEPPVLRGVDASFDHVQTGCRKDFWKRLGSDSRRTYDAYFELGNQLNRAFFSQYWNDDVKGLYRRWLACMSERGFPVDDEQAFLKDREIEHFDIALGTEEYVGDAPEESAPPQGQVKVVHLPQRRYVPSQQEVRMAVQDVRCRKHTGFNEAIMPLVRQTQARIAAEREHQFQELNGKVKALAKDAAALVNG